VACSVIFCWQPVKHLQKIFEFFILQQKHMVRFISSHNLSIMVKFQQGKFILQGTFPLLEDHRLFPEAEAEVEKRRKESRANFRNLFFRSRMGERRTDLFVDGLFDWRKKLNCWLTKSKVNPWTSITDFKRLEEFKRLFCKTLEIISARKICNVSWKEMKRMKYFGYNFLCYATWQVIYSYATWQVIIQYQWPH